MNDSPLANWIREKLGIKSPSKVFFQQAKQYTDAFKREYEDTISDPDYLRAMEIMRHKQWLHYVALQRKPEHKFKKARIRNGLM